MTQAKDLLEKLPIHHFAVMPGGPMTTDVNWVEQSPSGLEFRHNVVKELHARTPEELADAMMLMIVSPNDLDFVGVNGFEFNGPTEEVGFSDGVVAQIPTKNIALGRPEGSTSWYASTEDGGVHSVFSLYVHLHPITA